VRAAARAAVPISVVAGAAETVPAPDASFDAAVACLVLCSVSDQPAALAELRRVLRPGAQLRFYEHVIAENRFAARVQRQLDATGVWARIAGGCHRARDTGGALVAAGFVIESYRSFAHGPPLLGVPHITGVARRSF
jgi:ubiquinone/menaquinone biosynthesis C-methylase UbiE